MGGVGVGGTGAPKHAEARGDRGSSRSPELPWDLGVSWLAPPHPIPLLQCPLTSLFLISTLTALTLNSLQTTGPPTVGAAPSPVSSHAEMASERAGGAVGIHKAWVFTQFPNSTHGNPIHGKPTGWRLEVPTKSPDTGSAQPNASGTQPILPPEGRGGGVSTFETFRETGQATAAPALISLYLSICLELFSFTREYTSRLTGQGRLAEFCRGFGGAPSWSQPLFPQ